MTGSREAACHCGQLRVTAKGDPFEVDICNCLACQRRTGSAFGIQATFKREQVEVSGEHRGYAREEHTFHFCPECGSQVFQSSPEYTDFVVVSGGSFADPSFPAPTGSAFDSRRHPWVGLPDSMTRYASEMWDTVQPLFAEGRYAEAADRGRELLAQWPDDGKLRYNTACAESLAGRPDDAVEDLRRAIEIWEGCRDMAKGDADFDRIRAEPAFAALVES
ncbi:MAG TPA: GFA family protein [Solirubrobacteraceae bacterium]|jgi:hypothetical protein